MTSVSNIGTSFYNNLIVKSLSSQISDVIRQVSTGKVAAVYADLGTKAGTSLNLHAQDNALTGYVGAINNVKLKTDQMDGSLTNISNQIQTVTTNMDKLSQGGTPSADTLALIQSSARSALASITADLNTSVGGEYIFAGNQTNLPPIANTTAADTNAASIIANYTTGTPAATVISNLSAMTETQVGYDPGLAAAGNNTFQAGDNINLNYTMKADSGAFKDTITGLAEIANLSYDPNHAAAFWSLYNDAKSRLSGANSTITTNQGQLGVLRGEMTSLISTHQTTQLNVQSSISGIEDADLGQASSQLSTLQTQTQATYQVIANVSKYSLVNYLQ